ncbi:MAG: hypothetical protein RJA63_4101 [Pseudomonadota bacterium]|jgi:hypothetical protein
MPWINTRSPFIVAVSYLDATQELIVEYGSGHRRAFAGVPKVEVANLLHAPSLKAYWEWHGFEDRYPETSTDPE